MLRPRPIAPGVEGFAARTPTLPPATHTNSYALGERELLLVEPATPYEDEQREWIEWARSLVSQGRQLKALFVTHHHADHVGGAALLSRELGLPLWGHGQTAERLAQVSFARLLDDGDAIELDGPTAQRWRVLHTPGHAPGHLCLHEPALGQLVVGDMVASVGTILIEPGDGNMRVYIEQLERLEGLDAHTALPAHGDPIPSPALLFAHYVRHRLMRESKLVDALANRAESGATLDDLLGQVYDDTPKEIWPLARISLMAHLQKLLEEDRAELRGERYQSLS